MRVVLLLMLFLLVMFVLRLPPTKAFFSWPPVLGVFVAADDDELLQLMLVMLPLLELILLTIQLLPLPVLLLMLLLLRPTPRLPPVFIVGCCC